MSHSALGLLCLLVARVAVPGAAQDTLAIAGATLIDGRSGPPLPDAVVNVADARVVSATSLGAQGGPGSPSFREVLSLRDVGLPVLVASSWPAISPDGTSIAYVVKTTNWEHNRYEFQIWLARIGEEPFQLTRANDGFAGTPRWSPDGRWLAFIGDGRQIYLIRPDGGEARQLTSADGPVSNLHWAPAGGRTAFTATEPEAEHVKKRKELYGDVVIEDADYQMTHLWVVDVLESDFDSAEPKRLTGGDAFSVGGFSWSPDGRRIAFDHRRTPLITDQDSDVSILELASQAVTPLVAGPGRHSGPRWSPDGSTLVFNQLDKMGYGGPQQFLNWELAVVPAAGGAARVVTAEFDENPQHVAWTKDGIFFLADQGTKRELFRLNPDTGEVNVVGAEPHAISAVSFSADGRSVALTGDGPETLPEVYRTRLDPFRPVPVTEATSQVRDWPTGTAEVIAWESRDGMRIEGTLYKPPDFDASRRYPLLVNIHGGPMGVSRPQMYELISMGFLYPGMQWVANGALMLLPNYRGSAGYGEAFRSANVRHLGERDMWDVMSGVDYLIDQGMAHPDSLGLMGYSQGGYISAYLLTHTDRFKAVSVGGGVSSWSTYYVGGDIHQWARQYHQATPWEDPGIYAKTAPITTILEAKSPTLIQHGQLDARVPLQSALELYQGLQDVGVTTELAVFKGQGHIILSPKEQLLGMWQNWQWFARHLWGEEVVIPLE